MGKLSVAIQQPTAIARAFAYINPKYFAGIALESPNSVWDRMMKYSGTTVMKDMGGFNVGVGKQADDWIANGAMGDYNVWQRSKFLLPQGQFREAANEWTDFLTGLPGVMDKITWCTIWSAVEREQAAKMPNADRNSEEFLRAVGERFDDVVNHTQVYDSILSKSQNMRSRNALAKMATAFMAEPTLNMNMAYGAIVSKDAKRITSSALALLANAVLGAAAYAIIAAFSKDDDDRTLEEKYWVAFHGRFVENINPLTSIPYLTDVWNKMRGYDVERTDMSYIFDLYDYGAKFFDKVLDKDVTPDWRDHERFVGGVVAALTGVPVQNISADFRRLRNAITSDTSNAPTSRVGYGILDETILGRETSKAAYYQRYLSAMIDGD